MRASHKDPVREAQLNLFEPATSASSAPLPAPVRHNPPVEFVRESDLPVYSLEALQLVERALTALPAEKLWFTYADVKSFFGVSRATVARRVKDRLVPGVRILNGRVQDDGAVRRFDRTQLKWLLLSVRASRSTDIVALQRSPKGLCMQP